MISSKNWKNYLTNLFRITKFREASSKIIPDHSSYEKCLQDVILGQPTSWTHPHLLQDGEITPNIKSDEFKDRRLRLLNNILTFCINSKMPIRNHFVVIPSGTKKYISAKIPYVFRQNTDFFYFTGCHEPDSILLLTIDLQENMRSILFMRPKDKHAELWDGPRTGVERSLEYFGVDEVYDVNEFQNILHHKTQTKHSNDIFRNNKTSSIVWHDKSIKHSNIVNEAIAPLTTSDVILQNPTIFIHSLRVIKSFNEINLLRKSCQIASESINEVIQETKVGDSEHHIFARVDYKCRQKNADYLAYPPVVASGINATSIHYISNSQIVKNGDLILMDAGCEYGGYTSDITRTWPVNGEFTNAQQILYEMVLVLQKELLNTITHNGGRNLDELFETMCYKLGLYLQEIGIIPTTVTGVALSRAGYSFCPHHVSHYLGMDVHDTPLISRGTKLRAGMVCTVEPGIYIPINRMDVPKEFRGVGIRVEDDVLINSNSIEILTQTCKKEIHDIEKLCKS